MANKMRTLGRKVTSTPAARGATGIYNRHPSPGLGQYPATKGGSDIDEKFAETGIGDANKQNNQLRQSTGASRTGKAPAVTSSNMNRKKNNYRKYGKTAQS